MGSFSLFRLARFLSASCAPITAIIGFSCLLTVIFILYQPTTGPGEIQRMGWQSWDVIFPVSTDASTGDNHIEGGSQAGDVDTQMDWWNVTVADDKVDTASFPLDAWNPLLPHDTGREYACCVIFSCYINHFRSFRNNYRALFLPICSRQSLRTFFND
jgi:hypothetical protein